MKKNLLFVLAFSLGMTALQAKPVDVSLAQRLGLGFVQHKALFAKNAVHDLELSYTFRTDNGMATAYVFNFEGGFVVMAADDCVSPILGYSDCGNFDYATAPDGLLFMLGELTDEIERAVGAQLQPSNDIDCRWKNLEEYGVLHPDRGTPVVGPLISLKWNQDYPYDMFVPSGCPTGCVATAMAQLMKYWEWPVQGTGEHSYQWNGQTLSANFGETTYDWSNMVENYSSSAVTDEQRVAVATLMYHCGVSVDMMYEPGGSGAYSVDVPGAINSYFSYSDHATHVSKGGNYDEWIALLKSNIDQQIPLYYSGQSSQGGHAFICDGYDMDDLFHFNWGWGGASNGYFLIDGEHFDYTGSQAIIYDFVPDYIYNDMPKAAENLSVSIDSDVSRIGHLSWTNPTETVAGEALTTLEKVIVKRNGIVVKEIENALPGQVMTLDDEVPYFDQFEYSVLVANDGSYGRQAFAKAVFGPYCEWTVIMTSASFQGWDGGGITVQNAAGSYIDFLTTTTASASMQKFQMALGNNNLYWTEPNSSISNLSFKVKDAENQVVYEYSGPSSGLEAGLLRTLNNTCGHENVCEAPYQLKATLDPENDRNIILTWESDHEPEFGYCIYRDGFLFNMSHETRYVDENLENGGYCYYVTALCEGGETANSNEYCGTAGIGCEPPLNFRFNYTNNKKVQLSWDAPDNENVKGYVIYRRTKDTPYKRLKNLGATTYTFKDNTSMVDTLYYYTVVAYYQNIECYSAYASDMLNPDHFYLMVDWSNMPKDFSAELVENEEVNQVNMRWRAAFGVENYHILRNGVEIGVTTETEFVDNDLEAGETYCYQVMAEGDGFAESSDEACVETPAAPEPPILPCPAPFNLRYAIEPVDQIRLTWSHPVEERWPDYFVMTVIDHQTNDTTDVTIGLENNFLYQEDISHDGMDKSYKVKAVYEDCESEYGLTENGLDFIRFSNLSVGEQSTLAKLYPNPATSQVTIEAEGMTEVAVYDLIGQCMMNTVVAGKATTLDLSMLQSGIYLVKVSTKHGSVMEKVVKM